MKSENKETEVLHKKLFDSDTKSVLSALGRIKEKGNTKSLKPLVSLLNSDPGPEIEKEILFILNNLKAKDAVTEIINSILNPEYISIRKKLITCCWQNGLDFKNN